MTLPAARRTMRVARGVAPETALPGIRPAPWWRDAVIYQVYLRSFADGDGDGIGDLAGLTGRLEHLTRLGVDGLWLNPCYPSPGADHGYDVSDYMDIDVRYGGLPAFDTLLEAAHARGLRVIMDLVPNHCSVEHPWFAAALAAEPGSRERDRFIFRTTPARTRSGTVPGAPSTVAMAAGCRCRGGWTSRVSASVARRHGCRSRAGSPGTQLIHSG